MFGPVSVPEDALSEFREFLVIRSGIREREGKLILTAN